MIILLFSWCYLRASSSLRFWFRCKGTTFSWCGDNKWMKNFKKRTFTWYMSKYVCAHTSLFCVYCVERTLVFFLDFYPLVNLGKWKRISYQNGFVTYHYVSNYISLCFLFDSNFPSGIIAKCPFLEHFWDIFLVFVGKSCIFSLKSLFVMAWISTFAS